MHSLQVPEWSEIDDEIDDESDDDLLSDDDGGAISMEES